MSTQLIQPLVISALVVTEVAVWQLRVALATRGQKRSAAALGAVNAILSVVALAQVVTHLERPANVAGYAVGVAVGVYLGIVVDERLNRGPLRDRVPLDGDGDSLAGQLRHDGWRVTRQVAQGPDGHPAVLLVVLPGSGRLRPGD